MIPVSFPGQNVIVGENQPEYLPLPALIIDDDEGTQITCWQMSHEELQDCIANDGKFYIKQLRFRVPDGKGGSHIAPMQPLLPIVNLSDDITLI